MIRSKKVPFHLQMRVEKMNAYFPFGVIDPIKKSSINIYCGGKKCQTLENFMTLSKRSFC